MKFHNRKPKPFRRSNRRNRKLHHIQTKNALNQGKELVGIFKVAKYDERTQSAESFHHTIRGLIDHQEVRESKRYRLSLKLKSLQLGLESDDFIRELVSVRFCLIKNNAHDPQPHV